MDTLTALSVVALAALIHASFQLGVSIITALSSYARGRKAPNKTLQRLTGGFLGGVMTMTLLAYQHRKRGRLLPFSSQASACLYGYYTTAAATARAYGFRAVFRGFYSSA